MAHWVCGGVIDDVVTLGDVVAHRYSSQVALGGVVALRDVVAH
jgi:hypothetical protein